MSERLHVESLELSERLNYVFGDEDFVKCRRALFSCFNRQCLDGVYVYFKHCIGSMCDGCDCKQSDLDSMYVYNNVYVEDTARVEQNKGAPLLAVTSPRSSYVQIHLNKILTSEYLHVNGNVICYDRRLLLCCSLFVNNLNLIGRSDIVGPSSVRISSDGSTNDNVFALKCKSWPKIADEWIGRKRKYSWPSSKLVTFIKSKGCHYVPVGDYNSMFKDVEWRVSFVLSECALVRSFNHVQFKVYCLLKLFKSHLLDKYKHPMSSEILMTSYHMKTILFFAIENSPTSLWSNKNIIICFRMCIVYLKNVLISKYLPHYFLPNCNLFKKIAEAEHEPNKIVFEINRYISNPTIRINQLLNNYLPDGNNQNVFLKTRLYSFYSLILTYQTDSKLLFIQCLLDNFNSYSDFESTMITKITLDRIYCTNNNNERVIQGNKTVYTAERQTKYICLSRSHYDVAAGWLQLSTLYYVTHQYNKTEHICRKVLSSLLSGLFYIGRWGYISTLSNALFNCHMTVQQRVKQFAATYVLINMNGLYPDELAIEIANSLELTFIKIPPLQYAHFVLFLCAYHRRDALTQRAMLGTLESMIYDEDFGLCPNNCLTFILLNMIGICYELSGDQQKAAFYYRQSINMKTTDNETNPYEEAAYIRLQLLEMEGQ